MDHIPGGIDGSCFASLLYDLAALDVKCDVKHPCAVVSIVGRNLRKSLYCMGSLLAELKGHEVYLVSESAEALNLSFVVEENDADSIVAAMHAKVFEKREECSNELSSSAENGMGSSWQMLKEQNKIQKSVESSVDKIPLDCERI